MKIVKIVIGIIILTAIIILIGETGLLPFFKLNIFKRKPLKISETPVKIKQIRNIGELITAEFYGEVYADLNDAYKEVIKNYNEKKAQDTIGILRDSLSENFPLFTKYLNRQNEINQKKAEAENLKREFEELKKSLFLQRTKTDSIKKFVLKEEKIYNEKHTNYTNQTNELSKKLKELQKEEKKLKRRIRKLSRTSKRRKQNKEEIEQNKSTLSNIRDNIEIIQNELDEKSKEHEKAQTKYKEANRLYASANNEMKEQEKRYQKKEKLFNRKYNKIKKEINNFMVNRKNLVYIGRGWVKAGFNIKNITEDKLKIINRNDSTILKVTIKEPEILITDINPWYIKTKDEEIPGYEIFMQKGRQKKFTDQEGQMVKQICKQKLKEEAIKKDIIKKARNTGIETLIKFFNLMGFKYVEITFEPTTEPAV